MYNCTTGAPFKSHSQTPRPWVAQRSACWPAPRTTGTMSYTRVNGKLLLKVSQVRGGIAKAPTGGVAFGITYAPANVPTYRICSPALGLLGSKVTHIAAAGQN